MVFHAVQFSHVCLFVCLLVITVYFLSPSQQQPCVSHRFCIDLFLCVCAQKAEKSALDGKLDRNLFDSTVDDLKTIIDDVLGQLAESVRDTKTKPTLKISHLTLEYM